MSELLHAWALAPAAIGTCCLAADRRRVRVPELAASALMLLAMLDSALGGWVVPVYWAAFLLTGAMGLAAVGRGRGGTARAARATTGMTLHTTIGMVTMAALLLAMGQSDAETTGHAHGMGSAALVIVFVGGTLVYAIGSAIAAARAHGWLDRTQYVAMGLSTLVMAMGLLA